MTAPALSTADAATEADRLWFAQHPHRQHRIRLYQPGEGLPELPDPSAPPGLRWFVIVRRTTTGAHLRLSFCSDAEPAPGERAAARLFELVLAGRLSVTTPYHPTGAST
jgi:hypothetical protein